MTAHPGKSEVVPRCRAWQVAGTNASHSNPKNSHCGPETSRIKNYQPYRVQKRPKRRAEGTRSLESGPDSPKTASRARRKGVSNLETEPGRERAPAQPNSGKFSLTDRETIRRRLREGRPGAVPHPPQESRAHAADPRKVAHARRKTRTPRPTDRGVAIAVSRPLGRIAHHTTLTRGDGDRRTGQRGRAAPMHQARALAQPRTA